MAARGRTRSAPARQSTRRGTDRAARAPVIRSAADATGGRTRMPRHNPGPDCGRTPAAIHRKAESGPGYKGRVLAQVAGPAARCGEGPATKQRRAKAFWPSLRAAVSTDLARAVARCVLRSL